MATSRSSTNLKLSLLTPVLISPVPANPALLPLSPLPASPECTAFYTSPSPSEAVLLTSTESLFVDTSFSSSFQPSHPLSKCNRPLHTSSLLNLSSLACDGPTGSLTVSRTSQRVWASRGGKICCGGRDSGTIYNPYNDWEEATLRQNSHKWLFSSSYGTLSTGFRHLAAWATLGIIYRRIA